MSMWAKYNKYWDLSRLNVFLYVAIVLEPQDKVDGTVYGLALVSGKAWPDYIAIKGRETLKDCLMSLPYDD